MPLAPPPSSTAAVALVNGEKGSVPYVLGAWLGRAALVAPGVYLAGVRGRQLLYASLGASAFISGFLVYWYARQKDSP